MKKNTLLLIACCLVLRGFTQADEDMGSFIREQMEYAIRQYAFLQQNTPADVLPRTYDAVQHKQINSGADWWCSGFYPGTLLYLYQYSKNLAVKTEAEKRLQLLEAEQYNKSTHDLGFMLYCSYGNAWRLFGRDADKSILLNGARSLSTRFHSSVGCIKSWDTHKWQYPVIIDNMMNLELLTWATHASGDSSFYKIAVTHALTTMHHHFRSDYSSYHVVNYDTLDGKVLSRQTAQGYADESAWARGQAWGLYGYTMMFRETKNPLFLQQARNIAGFILRNPHLPADKVPYWDYHAPNIPNALRDASAGAVMASALLELGQYTKGAEKKEYIAVAATLLKRLGSPAYRAPLGTNGGFLLLHSVGSLPANSEVDVPLTYADYYFIEALLRYQKWYLQKK